MRLLTNITMATLCLILVASCGGTQFAGSGKKKKKSSGMMPNADAFGQKAAAGAMQESFPLASVSSSKPVDIIFVVDTSGSMREEKVFLEQKMAFFIQNLIGNSQNMDYRIYMIARNFNVPMNFDTSRFVVVNERVGSNDALEVLARFLTNQLMVGVPPRPNAEKHAVIVTDDNAGRSSFSSMGGIFGGFSSMIGGDGITAMEFKQRVGFMQQSPLHIHGFIGMRPGPNNAWCDIDGVGSEYMNLANDPMFSGRMQDLCTADWSTLMGNLAQNIVQLNQPTMHRLQRPLDNSRPVVVTVNGQPLDNASFQIDPATNSINISSATNFPPQSMVRIEYYPAQ